MEDNEVMKKIRFNRRLRFNALAVPLGHIVFRTDE